MSYRAPVADIAFNLKHAAGLKTALAEGLYGDLDEQTVNSVLAEAGRFATDIIAPLNGVSNRFGTPFKNGTVTSARLEGRLHDLGRGRLEWPRRAGRLGWSGTARL